jgi:hypothetical protein
MLVQTFHDLQYLHNKLPNLSMIHPLDIDATVVDLKQETEQETTYFRPMTQARLQELDN